MKKKNLLLSVRFKKINIYNVCLKENNYQKEIDNYILFYMDQSKIFQSKKSAKIAKLIALMFASSLQLVELMYEIGFFVSMGNSESYVKGR